MRQQMTLSLSGFLLLLVALTGCASDGGTNNPLFRPFQYFSYLNGDDIRQTCEKGGDSRYRLVYNALYEEQVRAYDIFQRSGAKEGIQKSRVFKRGLGAEVLIGRDGLDFTSNFQSSRSIGYDDLLTLDKALIDAGFEKPAPDGLVLHSDEFYWVAMVCRDGAFKYYAWSQDEIDIDALPFIEALSANDKTGVDVMPFRIPIIHDHGGRPRNGTELSSGSYFSVQVGNNGLKL